MQARRDFGSDLEGQARAGADGLADALTLGTGDYAGALTGAVFGGGVGSNFMDRYRSILAANKAQDAYDAEHFPIAHDAGMAVGTGLLIAATDGAATAPAAARLAPQTIRLAGSTVRPALQTARVVGATAGAGAGVGLVSQVAMNSALHRPNTAPELAGAVAGGATAGPVTLFRGPGMGAAADSVVNHAIQSALQGKPLDLPAILHDTDVGAGLGLAGGKTASILSTRLPPILKGGLGEVLSSAKSKVLGDEIIGRHKSIPGGGRTIADLKLKGFTDDTPRGVEAKFGPKSDLSYPQRYAQRVLGPLGRYYVDHWLSQDVAKGIGGLLGISASQASSNRNAHK